MGLIDKTTEAPGAKARLKSVFQFLDKDHTGRVDVNEIAAWGQICRGRAYSKAEVSHILDAYDVDKSGKLSLDEWIDYHDKAHIKDDTVDEFGNFASEGVLAYLSKEVNSAPPEYSAAVSDADHQRFGTQPVLYKPSSRQAMYQTTMKKAETAGHKYTNALGDKMVGRQHSYEPRPAQQPPVSHNALAGKVPATRREWKPK